MLEYLSSLWGAAISAAEPASRAAPATYESANGQVTVIIIIFYAQGISDTEGEEKILVRKCKRWNDH